MRRIKGGESKGNGVICGQILFITPFPFCSPGLPHRPKDGDDGTELFRFRSDVNATVYVQTCERL